VSILLFAGYFGDFFLKKTIPSFTTFLCSYLIIVVTSLVFT
jgi:hypothetical protein